MQIVELSNHPGKMRQDAERRRMHAAGQAQARYEKSLAEHHRILEKMRARRDQARARRRWWDWLKCKFYLWHEGARTPIPPAIEPVSDREEIITAGMQGEHAAVVAFSRILGDDWTLLQGYRNRRGEVDHILLGPPGLMAIEVKHRNATVHVNGDEWWFDKYDRYGNHVESGQISDRRGRSPSMQLHQPVNELERFLRSRGHPVSIQRAVLLTHPRSDLGSLTNLTVHVTTSPEFLIDQLESSRSSFNSNELAELRRLIIRDHRFHERPTVEGRYARRSAVRRRHR
jgi:hypothetical protein